MLGLIAGAGLVTVAGCATNDGSASCASSASAASSTAASSSAAPATSGGSCEPVPEETAGPYPADGSNGPDVLSQSGIVRGDIRSSFGTSSGVAQGVPLTIGLTVMDASAGCSALAGAAVYLWHCDRAGAYSLYSAGAAGELALPQDACQAVYATSGYQASAANLARTSLASDMVFRDGYTSQMATVTGNVSGGYVATLAVPV